MAAATGLEGSRSRRAWAMSMASAEGKRRFCLSAVRA